MMTVAQSAEKHPALCGKLGFMEEFTAAYEAVGAADQIQFSEVTWLE
jgi:hypothetical protein